MKKHDHPRCHSKRLAGRSADRPTQRPKRRLIRDVDHFRGVKAARTRLINRTTGRILVAFDYDDDGYSNAGRIRAILEDVL